MKIKKWAFPSWSIPLALLAACLVGFGLLSPTLGFYWDDFPYIWFAHQLGPSGFKDVFANDRPFLAVVYMLTTGWMGESPLAWQLFGIFCRWLAAVALWWTLRLLWPERKRQVTWVAFLFAIYPGFKQQWISVIYSHAFLILAAFLFSLGGMLLTTRQNGWKKWGTMALCLLGSAFSLWSTEYFFGLELLRPVFLWMIFSQDALRRRLKRAALYWLPYLGLWLGFLVWRVFLYNLPSYKVQVIGQVATSPLKGLGSLLWTVVQNTYMMGVQVWSETLQIPHMFEWNNQTTPLYWGALALGLVLALGYLSLLRFGPQKEDAQEQTTAAWGKTAAILGLFALLAGGVPFWAGGLQFGLEFPWDRFSLALMLGDSLLLVGLLEYFIRTLRQKVVLISLLIGLAVGSHFYTANTYRREWLNLKDFFWQMTWRIPAMKPNTMVLTYELPFTYYSDNSLTGPLNWVYAPNLSSRDLPYLMSYSSVRVGRAIQSLEPGQPVTQLYRAMTFHGATDDSVVIFYSPPGCLRVVDGQDDATLPQLPEKISPIVPLSNLSRILPGGDRPAQPPQPLFGDEPAHGWCYYFEKADLAQQMGDWQSAADLGAQAKAEGLSPQEPSEWLPFISAYAHLGQVDQAAALSEEAINANPMLQNRLCSLWKGLASIPEAQQTAGAQMHRLSCTK